ncbi:hypothetical protein N6L24_03675 [Cognatishimia sp. SS12]|uniref:hypothetical protein n=1 Tax=Cognatishimia sp. SS12 TaxID=2979465 RepID=UPI00232F8D47|nr:hypothetical protein [Cognatishimia sp. SS12]MDC0737365.1 hypothetical protein [Cognatishimia sp. SS12]
MFDPKGLIKEAYAIDGINTVQCRSIFLDWALGLPSDMAAQDEIQTLLDHYGRAHPDHPMTEILREGTVQMQGAGTRRRGGWRRQR